MYSASTNNLRVMPNIQNLPLKKMDILFYESINRLKRSYSFMVLYQVCKALIFIIFIPIDYTIINPPNSPDILAVMVLALVVSVLQGVSAGLFRVLTLNNSRLLLEVAGQMGHVTNEPVTGTIEELENCVSKTIFNQQNQTLITDEGLTEQIKNMYLNYLTSNLKEILVNSSQSVKLYDYFAEFSGFVAFVAIIVVLSSSEKNTPQLVLLIVFVVLEGLTKLLVIAIGLLMALSPLFCIVMVVCACFCRPQQQGEVKLPNPEKATEKMITDADGTCSICYQNFMMEENVIRLNCSSKHMFHPMCISGWAKLKATCPICRASLRDVPKNAQQNS